MRQKLQCIWAIIRKDLFESIKNRSIFIAVILPVVASLLFGILDNVQAPKDFEIAIYEEVGADFIEFISHTAANIELKTVPSLEDGLELVKKGKVHGFIWVQDQDYFSAYLDSGRPLYFFALNESIRQLVDAYLGVPLRHDLEIVAVGETTVSGSVLPVWITVTMSMIGVMVISGIFAEEKDAKTIEAVAVSPMGHAELLLGKGIFGVLLGLGAVSLMLVLNYGSVYQCSSWIALGSLVTMGAICFTSIGLLIGVFAKSQSSARSIATMIYFPLLFPTLIADFSNFTRLIASFLPTFHLFSGLEAVLIQGRGASDIRIELLILLAYSLILLLITYFAYQRMVNSYD